MRDIDRTGRTYQRRYVVVDVTGRDVTQHHLNTREFSALASATTSWRRWPLITSLTR